MKHILNELKDRAAFRLKTFDHVPERLFEELDYFNEHGGAHVLLYLSNLVRHLRAEGIYVGGGYGAQTCSMLCYGLGITDVNPLLWNLPFEKFTKTFEPETIFTIRTSTGGYRKAMEYIVSHQMENPVDQDTLGKREIDVFFPGELHYFALQIRIAENVNLDMLNILQKGRSTRLSLLELDEATLQLFRDGECGAVMGFGTPERAEYVKRFGPECFSDLYLIYALWQSGKPEMLEEVIRMKAEDGQHATGVVEVDRILAESYGTLIYQEQAILIEKALLRTPDSPETMNVKVMLETVKDGLISKGNAIVMTKEAVEQAFFKARCPEAFSSAFRAARKIRVAKISEIRKRNTTDALIF